jgi:hypothetical protein
MKRRGKQKWLTISLVNLMVVALLGFILRSKILFSIPFIDFKNTLHAHSHFAFGGWVSLAIITLLAYEILPKSDSNKPIYQWLFGCITINAWGMLLSFLWQGYALFSMLFSTLFIFTTYTFAWVFIKHVRKSAASNTIKLLSIASVTYMALSSVGPYTLAYLMASKSGNVILYKDAVYTYLHLQYNGFFTLGIFALLLNRIENLFTIRGLKKMERFAWFLNLSIIPSLFLCYLWHYPNSIFKVIAITGSITMLLSTGYFIASLLSLRHSASNLSKTTLFIVALSMVSFILKMLLQSLTIFEKIGAEVFSNRPVIIGFLHLVLLGFITLYLLSHFVHAGMLGNSKLSSLGLFVFTSSVVINEILLMSQGLGIMLMESSKLFPWMLWVAALGLFTSSMLLVISRFEIVKNKKRPVTQKLSPEFRMLFKKSK